MVSRLSLLRISTPLLIASSVIKPSQSLRFALFPTMSHQSTPSITSIRSITTPSLNLSPCKIECKESRYTRKAGVASPSELQDFIAKAGDNIVIVDARNPDFSLEAGDEITSLKAPISGFGPECYRPKSVNIPYNRMDKDMDLSTEFCCYSIYW